MFEHSTEINQDHHFFKISVGPDVDMRKLSDDFISKKPNSTGLIFCQKMDKVQFLLRTDKKIKKKVDVGKILKEHISILNGRGGGKPHMAQGSGEASRFDTFTKGNNIKPEEDS